MQTKKKKGKYFLLFPPFLSFATCLSLPLCPLLPAGVLRKTRAQLGEKLKTFWKKIGIENTEDNNTAEVQMNIS